MKSNFLIALFSSLALLVVVAGITYRSKSDNPPYEIYAACSPLDISGRFDLSENIAYFDGREFGVPDSAVSVQPSVVLGIATEERWIEIDLSEQKLKAWEGDRLFLEAPISSGLPWWKTPEGEFRVWIKLRSTKMEGGQGEYYYYVPNVPHVMFFENTEVPGWKGYGLHGAYWHNDFGNPRSHGCVNLPLDVAEQIYNWSSPVVPEGKWMVKATESNPGTRIIIHE